MTASRLRTGCLAFAFALALGGCGGGGGGSAPVNPPPAAQTGLERLTITIPAKSSSLVKRTPRYISSLTQSVTIAVPGGASTTFSLTTSSPNCTSGSAGLTCMITFPVPVGTTSVQFATFASTDGTGTPLSVATVPVTVTAGQVNDVTVTLNGVVKTVAVSVTPTAVSAGTAATVNVSVSAFDQGGAVIAGPGNYVDAQGNTLTLTLTDSDTTGATHLSQTTFTAPPSAAVTMSYNGASIADVTLTLSAPNVTSATASLHINAPGTQQAFVSTRNNRCGSSDAGDVYAYAALSSPGGGIGPLGGKHILSSPKAVMVAIDRKGYEDVLASPDQTYGGIDVVARYRQTDTGLTNPVYEITGPNTLLSNAVAIDADSTGAVWVAQPATATRPAMLMQFGPTATGNVAPVRTITAIAGMDPKLTFTARTVAVDSHDNVYTFAMDAQTGGGRIYELAAGSTGTATPLASYLIYPGTVAAFGGGSVQFISIDQHTDAVWAYPVTIYPGDTTVPPPNQQPIDGNGASRFSPGTTTADRVFYGQNAFNTSGGTNLFPPMLTSMAFDDRGNVYVEYGAGTHSNDGCVITRVSTFSPSQHGNVAPVDNKTIGGAEQPIGIGIPYTTPPTPASSTGRTSSAVMPSPSALSFVATGPSYAKPLTVSESGYGGAFTARSGNTAIATVDPSSSSSGSFTVTAVGAGNTSITVSDASGNSATVAVTGTITALHLQGRH